MLRISMRYQTFHAETDNPKAQPDKLFRHPLTTSKKVEIWSC